MPQPGERDPSDVPAFEMEPAARRKALLTVAFTLFLDLVSFGIILPVLPYYAEAHGGSPAVVALLSTAFSVSQFVMSPVLGRMSDRRGRRPVMLISIAGSIASALVLGYAHALWVVFAARLLSGASKANVSTAHAYVSDIVKPSQRARYMGLMGAALGMGFVFGPAIGGLLSTPENPTLPFFAAAGLSVINLLMAWRWLPETHFVRGKKSEKRRRGLAPVLEKMKGRAFGSLIVIVFVYFMAFALMESTFALFSEHEFGWHAFETGIFLTFIGLCIAMAQGVLVGIFVEKFGEATTMSMGIVSLGVGLGLMGLLPQLQELAGSAVIAIEHGQHPVRSGGSLMWALIGAFGVVGFCTAVGNGLMMAPSSALVSRTSAPDEIGFNMGIKESSSALARITGPIVAGVLFEAVNPGAPMLAGAGFCALNMILIVQLHRRLRAEKVGSGGQKSG